MKKKVLFGVIALALVACVAIGGTIAYLTFTTKTITNTFTVGKIDFGDSFGETTGSEYKMVPGTNMAKDPKLVIKKGSETAWVFIEVKETNVADYLTWAARDGWTQLTTAGCPNKLYYRTYTADANNDTTYYFLAGDAASSYPNGCVAIKDTVSGISGSAPQLAFKAGAIQKEGTGTVAEAWVKLAGSDKTLF